MPSSQIFRNPKIATWSELPRKQSSQTPNFVFKNISFLSYYVRRRKASIKGSAAYKKFFSLEGDAVCRTRPGSDVINCDKHLGMEFSPRISSFIMRVCSANGQPSYSTLSNSIKWKRQSLFAHCRCSHNSSITIGLMCFQNYEKSIGKLLRMAGQWVSLLSPQTLLNREHVAAALKRVYVNTCAASSMKREKLIERGVLEK